MLLAFDSYFLCCLLRRVALECEFVCSDGGRWSWVVSVAELLP